MQGLKYVAVLMLSPFAVAQTVSVGNASSVQTGSTTTITVPVTVTGVSSGTSAGVAAALPMLSVETVQGSAGQPIGAAFSTLTLGSVISDTGKGWSASTNQYTVPATGTYLIISRVRLADGAPAGVSYGQGVNSSNVDGTFFQWNTTAGLRNGSVNMRLVQLAAGKTLDLYVYADQPNMVQQASLTIQELN